MRDAPNDADTQAGSQGVGDDSDGAGVAPRTGTATGGGRTIGRTGAGDTDLGGGGMSDVGGAGLSAAGGLGDPAGDRRGRRDAGERSGGATGTGIADDGTELTGD